jgi:P-type Mg2+ transporter
MSPSFAGQSTLGGQRESRVDMRTEHPDREPPPRSSGLTSVEASRRLAEQGPNEPAPTRRLSAVVEIGRLSANPLVLILLVASGVSAWLGEDVDAGIIATIVLLSVGINFWQSYRSQRAADRLRASVAPTATVLRDGTWQETPLRQIVPGDVVRLSAGDLVPADARLLDARDLSVQQSMLTGESLPADKMANAGQTHGPTGPGAPDLVFLGTSVVSGTATAIVTATGPRTLFGDIATRLRSRVPETEFERGMRRFSLLILRTTTALVLFILLMGIVVKHDALQSLLFAVALGVGLTPEFLPMIATVTLTQGALRMARDKVIVTHLPAIQNLGSIDILCSDKTGTLTTGVMELERSLDPAGAISPRPLALASVNSGCQTGIRSPLDAAILQAAPPDASGCAKVDEIPFDFERRRLSVVVSTPEDARHRLLITKGAPESLLAICDAMEIDGQVSALDAAAREASASVYGQLSTDGRRVLAVAYRQLDVRDAYSRDDESHLVLAGFISFADQILDDVSDVLEELRRDGVTVKILTGDNPIVARHVCQSIGLDEGRLVTGDDIEGLDDGALGHVAEQGAIFARVSPAEKNRIILALKRRGHVVGFLGDGINDAPSLHAADVGISVMGAADVAREAADVILGERSLRVLHRGILAGRRASGNMMKYLLMGTSSNLGNVFSMAAASVFLPFLPMLPTQILLNNFLYDVAQITIPTDKVDPSYLRLPQRWDMGVIRDFMLFIGPISSLFDFLTFYVLLRVFHAGEAMFHSGWFVESLATQTLVLFVIRTMGNPFRSKPSRALTVTTLAITGIGVSLPWTPLAGTLGFTPLPAGYVVFLLAASAAYLALVEVAKRWLVGRHEP